MSPHPQYPTDLTDKQWQRILPLLPARKWHPGGPGRPPCDRRQVINGIIYVTKTGCQWEMMPHTFGRWKTVYGYFNTWSRQGHWQLILEVVTRSDRVRQGRKPQPSAGSVDSQSIKTSTIVQSLLSSNFAVIPQFLVKGIFFNQIQVDV